MDMQALVAGLRGVGRRNNHKLNSRSYRLIFLIFCIATFVLQQLPQLIASVGRTPNHCCVCVCHVSPSQVHTQNLLPVLRLRWLRFQTYNVLLFAGCCLEGY